MDQSSPDVSSNPSCSVVLRGQQNHKVTEKCGWEGSSGYLCSNLLLKAETFRAGCSGPCTIRFWVSPRTEFPQLFCFFSSLVSIWLASFSESLCLHLMGAFDVPACAYCLLSCQHTSNRVCLHLLQGSLCLLFFRLKGHISFRLPLLDLCFSGSNSVLYLFFPAQLRRDKCLSKARCGPRLKFS